MSIFFCKLWFMIEKSWHNLALLSQVCKKEGVINIQWKIFAKELDTDFFVSVGMQAILNGGYVCLSFKLDEIVVVPGWPLLSLYLNFIRQILVLETNLSASIEFCNSIKNSQPIRAWTPLE